MSHTIRLFSLLGLGSLLIAWSQATALQVPGPLVETAWLADHAGEVVILDVRKNAKTFSARPKPAKGSEEQKLVLKSLTGHVPGAVSVPWKKFVVKQETAGTELKAMAPPKEAFEKLMRYLGVNDDSAIVVTGRGVSPSETSHAARFYWTLKYFGHDNVALLNGGTAQWAKEERPLAYDQPMPAAGNFTVRAERGELLATADEVRQVVDQGGRQLVDARDHDHYLGLTFSGDFVTPEARGHLPGAVNLPIAFVVNSAGPTTVHSKPVLEAAAALKGVELQEPTTIYCYTGVFSSLTWFVMHEVLGNKDVDMFDGSMHQWSRNPAPPVEALVAAR